MTAGPDNVGRLAKQVGDSLRIRGTPERAEHEKAYLKSELEHYGASVPAIRSVAKEVASHHPELSHDDLLVLAGARWAALSMSGAWSRSNCSISTTAAYTGRT